MLRKLVPKKRLERALKIPDSSVLEYVKVSENPLKIYCKIQGSRKEPYIVILDLERKMLGHYCADFGKHWCKHIGKVLSSLSNEELDEIGSNKELFHYVNNDRKLEEYIKDFRENAVIEEFTESGLPLNEYIRIICKKSLSASLDKPLLKAFNDQLQAEFSNADTFIRFSVIYNSLSDLAENEKEQLTRISRDVITKAIEDGIITFCKNFWQTHTIKRLDITFLIKEIVEILKIDIPFFNLEFPSSLTRNELIDGFIFIEIMFGSDSEKFNSLLNLVDIEFTEEERLMRIKRIRNHFLTQGSYIERSKEWLESELKEPLPKVQQSQLSDNFLIYLMNANQERPKYQIQYSTRSFHANYGYIQADCTTYPTLCYILDHIKRSPREYITKYENQLHPKFFKWLSGEEFTSPWREKIRPRELLHTFKKGDIIIQWDINANYIHKEPLHVNSSQGRYIFSHTSPLAPLIQPFDLTLCCENISYGGLKTSLVEPKFILHPDQVIDYISKGVSVISNVLPWHILTNFSLKGYVYKDEVQEALKVCNRNNFAFGCTALKKELLKLPVSGERGILEEDYEKHFQFLIRDSGRLNSESRSRCEEILLKEGKDLDNILKLYDEYNRRSSNKLLFILQLVRESPTLSEFRTNLAKEFLVSFHKWENLSALAIRELYTNSTGNYSILRMVIKETLKKSYLELGQILKEKISKRDIGKNMLGFLILRDLDIFPHGTWYKGDKERFLQYFNESEAYFT